MGFKFSIGQLMVLESEYRLFGPRGVSILAITGRWYQESATTQERLYYCRILREKTWGRRGDHVIGHTTQVGYALYAESELAEMPEDVREYYDKRKQEK